MKTKNLKNNNLIGSLLLLFATIAWGSSFVLLKETIKHVPTFYVLAIRFLISSIILALIFYKSIKKIDKKTLIKGLFLGIVLSFAYAVQTVGLSYTTPARNAFLTASYCVMTPFIVWILTKKPPLIKNLLSAITCIIGIGFVAFSSGDSGNGNYLFGDVLTFISAIFYGIQIVFTSKFQKDGCNTVSLLLLQLFVVGVIMAFLSLIFEVKSGIQNFALNKSQLLEILYLTIVCTLMAQSFMIFGQKMTSVSKASLILSLEAVFGTLFSVILGVEDLTVYLFIGFAIIFIAMMINEFDVGLIKRLIKPKNVNKK